MSKTAIMGFGNPCRSDDGIGCYVIDRLTQEISDERVTFFDMGTSAFEVLFNLKNHNKIIIVDAVINSGEKPGTIYKLPASEINASIQDDPMVFLHSLKWDQALSYAKKILQDAYPEDIVVYLISVDNTRLEIELSAEVKEAGEKVIKLIKEELLQTIE
ncbi:hydrogenase maturation protease [Jiulongibacter sediminis]|uniref:Hydrogenase maturation protease n=1 Tax=Jiulongibacter sediminis TaxID=1605367 RepID=A0A0N8HAB8_9BACT|nr:hydrogenase maturation protease [Jiulongibacter sediminis]KPM49732.1 hydrogenase maturation protease [Jiulongibacter sediminis]TBX26769.1 hydrogenase maturation protease [Jiulongibacter sediminis]